MKTSYLANKFIPVSTIVILIGLFWYLVAVPMNSDKVSRQFKNLTASEHILKCWSLKKPKLPTPHQIITEMVNTTFFKKISSKRSLVYHGWITLQATLAGFFLGTLLGILLALGIVHNKAMDLSVMPWVIASQTIPILAIAPMIIVVMNSVGVTGLLPKAIISMYLSFFPVVVGMVKGLRSPDQILYNLKESDMLFTLSFCFIKGRSCCFAGWGHSWRTSFGCYCRFGGQNASRHLLWSDNYDLERFVCCCFSCRIFSFYNRFLTKNHA